MSQYHADLFEKLLKGNLSPQETEELVSWLGTEKLDSHTEELIAKQLGSKNAQGEVTTELQIALENRLPHIIGGTKQTTVFQMRWLRYAAILIVLLGCGIFYLSSKNNSPEQFVSAPKIIPVKNNDIEPGKQGAVLTLADGRTIVLDSLKNGIVATQNGSKILLNNGQLVYDKHSLLQAETEYNTIATPRGRQFQLTLSDGTQVWLNAGSSLRYPTVFNGKERKVEITGEAYFEVAKNAQQPFKVSVNNETEIKVLGTHFNVNAYSNETTINTTLLEGSVQVYHNGKNAYIKPGQQLQVAQPASHQLKFKLTDDINIARILAWKNGVFNFDNATLGEVMRQLERWYDVDVEYEQGVPKLEFYGKMGRDLTLSNVLRGLQISKVNFRVEGKKLIVLP
jgi:transmembrane sensor